jgi:hypothetical protein
MSKTTEPITSYRIPLVGPEAPALAWQEASRNQIWSARRTADAALMGMVEVLPEGRLRIPDRDRIFHIVPAGRPHRVEHAFGFWRSCGADVMYVKSVYEAGVAYMMVVSTAAEAYTADALSWACLKCGTELRSLDIPTRRLRLRGLLERSLTAVREFNAEAAARTCASCSTVHPLAYGFEPAEDNDEERAARALW